MTKSLPGQYSELGEVRLVTWVFVRFLKTFSDCADVTFCDRAFHSLIRSGDWKSSIAMVERRVRPTKCGDAETERRQRNASYDGVAIVTNPMINLLCWYFLWITISGSWTNLRVMGAHVVRETPGKIFCVVLLHFFDSASTIAVLESAFVMASTVWWVYCVLFFYSWQPRAKPLKVGEGGMCPMELAPLIRIIYSITGWPKKVSHYQESLLNRIKNRQCGYISHQLWV